MNAEEQNLIQFLMQSIIT